MFFSLRSETRLSTLPAVILRFPTVQVFAIVDIAGFQEKVSEGDTLQVPTLDAKEGASVTFDKILMFSKGDDKIEFGAPYVSGAKVEATVVSHGRSDKIRVFKMKRRKRYRKTIGHRQGYTMIEIGKIKVN